MRRVLGNGVVFVILYLLCMLPTYILPWIGSNSTVLNAAGTAADAGMNPAFWLHLAALLVLVGLTWIRGFVIGKKWLIIFPFLALVFDLTPFLNWIPLVPTVMHLLAMILGVASSSAPVRGARRTGGAHS